MESKVMLLWAAIVGIGFLAAQAKAQDGQPLKTQKEKVSYAIGVDGARNFKRLGIDLDLETMIKALRDVYSGNKLAMTEDDLRTTMNAYQTDLRDKQSAAARKAGEDNKREGEAFLTQNKAKEGVATLPSGLQYKVMKRADGKKPGDDDTVEVNYRGTFIDGTEFDSSYRRGQPMMFKPSGVIPGWREALKLMPVGSKWQLFIPARLAYGEGGANPSIGPNRTLIFEVELLAIR
jgi:FKBP-type peptidyl-prolyl cis-trans isomerase